MLEIQQGLKMTMMVKGTIVHLDQADGFEGYCGGVHRLINPSNSNTRNLSVSFIHLKPGNKTSAHLHPLGEEIYYIFEGTGIIEVGGQREIVRSGSAVHIPAGQIHQLVNLTSEALKLLVINSPPYNPDDVIHKESDR